MKRASGKRTSINQPCEVLLVVAAKYLGEMREILGLRVNPKGEFFAFTPSSRLAGRVDAHASKHVSGERHFIRRVARDRQVVPATKVLLQPLSSFVGIEALMPLCLFKGQFSKLPLPGTNKGELLFLDLDSANFQDDLLSLNIYLVEPHKESLVPKPSNVGPRILHLIKKTSPWIAIEVFQQASA